MPNDPGRSRGRGPGRSAPAPDASNAEMRSKPCDRRSYTHTLTSITREHAAISMPPPQPLRPLAEDMPTACRLCPRSSVLAGTPAAGLGAGVSGHQRL